MTTSKTQYKFSPVREIPREDIGLRPDLFQGREHAYAEETVAKIMTEGYDKSQEPIVVWEDENAQAIVISGHSRFEASRRLFEQGHSELATMPVKYFLGDLEEAVDYALLESNRSGTAEGLQSDLAAYKRALSRGYNREQLRNFFKPERFLKMLQDLSFLNPKGMFLDYLGSDSEKHFPYLERNARWVGQLRAQLPTLTHAHEKELFDFLYPQKGGKFSRLEITKDKFFDRVSKQALRIDFDPERPLNLEQTVSTTSFTDPVREKIREIDKEIEGYEKRRSKLDESIREARSIGDEKAVGRHEEKQREQNQLIQRALEEKQRLEKEITGFERTLTVDLFSGMESPEPKEEKIEEEEEKTTEKVKEEPEPKRNEGDIAKLLSKRKWFLQHPEKVLGIEEETTDAWGKDTIVVKGSWENIRSGIDLSAGELPEVVPLTGGNTLPLNQRNNLLRAIEATEAEQARVSYRKALGLEIDPHESKSFSEVLKEYNPGISEEEMQVWVWSEYRSGRMPHLPEDSGWRQWLLSEEEARKRLEEWLESGLVCFYQGEYLPAVRYYAGSIPGRLSELEQDRARIVALHDQKQYERQKAGLIAILPERLRLDDPEPENRLVLNPRSQFFLDCKVTELADGQKMEVIVEGRKEPKPLPMAFSQWIANQGPEKFGRSNAKMVQRFFIEAKTSPKGTARSEALRLRRHATEVGRELLSEFLAKEISEADRRQIEERWNDDYNSFVEVNYAKVPIGFTLSKTFKNKPLFIRGAQREGVAFVSERGSGCLAYDVGLGKTMTAILSLGQALESGRCRRPLVVVPNGTYENWLAEIRGKVHNGRITQSGILTHFPVNGLYNLSQEFLELVQDETGHWEAVPDFSITVMTYEGFSQLGFTEMNQRQLASEFFEILNQSDESDRKRAKLREKIEELMGKGTAGGVIPIEALGFDYLVVDEAHAAKKSFTRVRGEIKGGKRSRSGYAISSGEPSSFALRTFMMAHYIQKQSPTGNVLLLTATPFTNSPLEIYSMLALIAYRELAGAGIHNLKTFFDHYIRTSQELIINARLQPERKEIVTGFNNLVALRQLIGRFIRYKTGEEANIVRPHKIVLPGADEDGPLRTSLQPSAMQKRYMEMVESYLRGLTPLWAICPEMAGVDPELVRQGLIPNVEEEEPGTAVLRGLGLAAQLAISPWLFACQTEGEPTAKQFVEDSPKILYAVRCIESVRRDSRAEEKEMPGQVIFIDRGVKFFPLIKEYLVTHSKFSASEVGIIHGGVSTEEKERVKEAFLSGEVKILIGSGTIREGINLQTRATDLYVLSIEWNPTDIKQLEGRIWRQGNRYANVRIVFPLVENTVDIFKFQKLQEKTARINEIWHKEGRKNALDLSDFDPSELKRSLITDPEAVAELLIIDEKEEIEDEIMGLNALWRGLRSARQDREKFRELYPDLERKARAYRPGRGGVRSVEATIRIYREWLLDPESEVYRVDEERLEAVRKFYLRWRKAVRDVLEPRSIPEDFILEEEKERLKREIKFQSDILKERTGEEAKSTIAARIVRERAEKKEKPGTLEERVAEFASLNPIVVTDLMVTPAANPPQVETTNITIGPDNEFEELEAILREIDEIEAMILELETI